MEIIKAWPKNSIIEIENRLAENRKPKKEHTGRKNNRKYERKPKGIL